MLYKHVYIVHIWAIYIRPYRTRYPRLRVGRRDVARRTVNVCARQMPDYFPCACVPGLHMEPVGVDQHGCRYLDRDASIEQPTCGSAGLSCECSGGQWLGS